MTNTKPDNPNDIDSDIECNVLRMFIDARDTKQINERSEAITKAIGAYFRNKDKGVYFVKSREIADKVDNVLSSKHLGHGFKELEENNNEGFELERYSNSSPTLWRVKVL